MAEKPFQDGSGNQSLVYEYVLKEHEYEKGDMVHQWIMSFKLFDIYVDEYLIEIKKSVCYTLRQDLGIAIIDSDNMQ